MTDRSAEWCLRLQRAFGLGESKRLVCLRAAGPEHMRPTMRCLAAFGHVHLALNLAQLAEVPKGATVVFAPQPHEMTAANLARPIFSQHRLHALLLLSDADYLAARRVAPDLLDWVSHTVEASPWVPDFVVESLRLINAHFPGLCWAGGAADLPAALEAAFPGAPLRQAPSPVDYPGLVKALANHRGWVAVPVSNEAEGLRLRAARAEAHRGGRVVALGAEVVGWPTVLPRIATWAELAEVEPQRVIELDCEWSAHFESQKVEPLDAVSGRAPLPALRAALTADSLTATKRARARAAREAIWAGDVEAIDEIAGWAEQSRPLPATSELVPRLAAAALPALLGANREVEASMVAQRMAWNDLARRWLGERVPLSPVNPFSATHEWMEPDFRPALDVVRGRFGDAHPAYATLLHSYANSLIESSRSREAEDILRTIVKIHEAANGRLGFGYGVAIESLARVLLLSGRYGEAEALFREAVTVLRAPSDGLEASHHRALVSLIEVLRAQGRYDEADTIEHDRVVQGTAKPGAQKD